MSSRCHGSEIPIGFLRSRFCWVLKDPVQKGVAQEIDRIGNANGRVGHAEIDAFVALKRGEAAAAAPESSAKRMAEGEIEEAESVREALRAAEAKGSVGLAFDHAAFVAVRAVLWGMLFLAPDR